MCGAERPVRAFEGRPTRGDRTCQRQARIRIWDPQNPISEESGRQVRAITIADNGVEDDRVRVDDEALGHERMEQQLDGGSASACLGEASRQCHAHDRVGTRFIGFGGCLEQGEERRHVERYEGVRGQHREWKAAGLDVEDPAGLGGGIPPPAREKSTSSP